MISFWSLFYPIWAPMNLNFNVFWNFNRYIAHRATKCAQRALISAHNATNFSWIQEKALIGRSHRYHEGYFSSFEGCFSSNERPMSALWALTVLPHEKRQNVSPMIAFDGLFSSFEGCFSSFEGLCYCSNLPHDLGVARFRCRTI